jgi:hypothetical protein
MLAAKPGRAMVNIMMVVFEAQSETSSLYYYEYL